MDLFQGIRKSLLVVESDAEKRNLLLTYFKKGVECDAVESIDEAVDAAALHEYSAVLAPLMPPELTGLELIPMLERLSPHTVPIFTSEIESAGNTVKAYRTGAFDVVQMPMSLQKLETAVLARVHPVRDALAPRPVSQSDRIGGRAAAPLSSNKTSMRSNVLIE